MFNIFFMLRIAVKHWVALLLAAIIAGGAVFAYFNFMTEPKYSARGSIIVTNGTIIVGAPYTSDDSSLKQADVVTSLNFAETVTDILKNPPIYKELAHEIGDVYSFAHLQSMATIKRRNEDTLFIDVTFTTNDPAESVGLVNKYLELAPDYINKVVSNTASYVTPADSASEVYINTMTMTGIAAIAGAAAVYLIIFLIYSSDSIIRDEESFRERFDIPVIGVIPDFTRAKSNESKYYRYSKYYGYGGKKNDIQEK